MGAGMLLASVADNYSNTNVKFTLFYCKNQHISQQLLAYKLTCLLQNINLTFSNYATGIV